MDYQYYLNKTLGKCLITDLIGVGGMGWVYLGRHAELSVPRAVKILKPVDVTLEESRRKLLVERFVREGRIAANLNHRNIIKIHDVGAFEGTYYIEMEYLKGVSLRQFVTDFDNCVPEDIAAAVIYLCSDAIAYAHHAVVPFDAHEIKGVIHRDLKPENIFITRQGDVKILDFGIAKLSNISLTTSTEARDVTGTIAYMSPEQIDGARVGPQSDIFSLGTVFYELLTGKNPFLAEQMVTTVKNISLCRYRPLSEIRPGLNAAFSRILQKCLKYNPSDRFQSASEIRDTAFQILASHGIYNVETALREFVTTGRVTLHAGIPAPRSRRRVYGLAATAVLLCAAGVTYFMARSRPLPPVPSPVIRESAPPEPAQIEPTPLPPSLIKGGGTDAVPERSPAKTTARVKPIPKQVVAVPAAVPVTRDTVAKDPDYPDSIRACMAAGNDERALGLMLPRMSKFYAVNYASSFPAGDKAYDLMKGLNAYYENNFKMAVSYFETCIRKPTRFTGLRHRILENALYYKALSCTALFKNGDASGRNEAIKSWEGLKKMTSDSTLIEKADRTLKELKP